MTHKINDLVEDNEGDKAVVVETDPTRGVRVSWDCTADGVESGWIADWKFSNLSERVRELDEDATRDAANDDPRGEADR